jgi:hypothetical protein
MCRSQPVDPIERGTSTKAGQLGQRGGATDGFSIHPILSSMVIRQVSRTVTKTGYASEIGKAVAAAISNASSREKRIGDIGMLKGGCLPGSFAEKGEGSSMT